MKVSISLGGSLLTRSGDAESYRRYAAGLRKIHDEGHIIVVVCGGGRSARQYIDLGKELGASRNIQDRLGILTTHLNATLLIAALGDAADQRLHRRGTEVKAHIKDKIIIGGGHAPGSSTDYRAALFAGAIDADLIINATDYPGVFDKDPRKYQNAKKYDTITYKDLEKIIKTRFKQGPGDYGLFDLKALHFTARNHIPVAIIDGRDPEEIVQAVHGKINGTLITS
ncbi:MAG: UMP kinase [Candidatus Bathyarchaeota archaeon]|nr:UMP kinase [Candidatus Bathyarchaeota archaeon]